MTTVNVYYCDLDAMYIDYRGGETPSTASTITRPRCTVHVRRGFPKFKIPVAAPIFSLATPNFKFQFPSSNRFAYLTTLSPSEVIIEPSTYTPLRIPRDITASSTYRIQRLKAFFPFFLPSSPARPHLCEGASASQGPI